MSIVALHPHKNLSMTVVFKNAAPNGCPQVSWPAPRPLLAKPKVSLMGSCFPLPKRVISAEGLGSLDGFHWLLESLKSRLELFGYLDHGVSRYSQAMDLTETPPSI